MKPFSSIYYIQKNSKRVFSIIIIIGMLSLCYLGGVYMDNIAAEAKALINHQSKFVTVQATYKDEEGKQFNGILQDLKGNNLIDYFQVGTNNVGYKTMLGFQNGSEAYCFTLEDFRRFNSHMNYVDEEFAIEDDMMILSKKEAKTMKVMQGDTISYDNEYVRNYYGSGEYKVGALIDVDAFVSYFIIDDLENSSRFLILPKAEYQAKEYNQFITELKNKYDKLIINDNNYRIKNAKEIYAINNVFFIAIIVLISIVFVITANAALVGLYDKRVSEFEIYHSLGIPKVKIKRKVIGEIALINGIGVLLCATICIITIFMLNYLLFEPDGLRMRYFAPIAMLATMISDIVIVVVCILLRLRMISKLKMAA